MATGEEYQRLWASNDNSDHEFTGFEEMDVADARCSSHNRRMGVQGYMSLARSGLSRTYYSRFLLYRGSYCIAAFAYRVNLQT